MLYLRGFPALPSQFQLGDKVRARGVVGLVSGILFRAGKVFYEVGGAIHVSDDVTAPLTVVGDKETA